MNSICQTSPDNDNDRKKISAIIGEAYKTWRPMDIVTISSPTGSGKTYFVLHVLLKWVIDEYLQHNIRHQIIYYVNRKILKNQLEEDLNHEIQVALDQNTQHINAREFIKILTYQEFQEQVKLGNPYVAHPVVPDHIIDYRDYVFVVYDECHYFLSDSVFNPETYLAFDELTRCYDADVQIFMSATIDDINEYLNNRYDKSHMTTLSVTGKTPYFASGRRVLNLSLWQKYDYPSSIDYRFVKLYSIDDDDRLSDLVKDKEIPGKWLIFVNDKAYGRLLCKELGKDDRLKDRVIFLDAEYENDIDASEDVNEIVSQKCSSRNVLICTSVLDTGVSLVDDRLTNIVILCDMQEEFLQMLGRKRFDGKEINLFICKRNKQFFAQRKNAAKLTREVYLNYKKYIDNWSAFDNQNNFPNRQPTINFFDKQYIINKILKSEYVYSNIRRFCYSKCGTLYISLFSVDRIAKMEDFYSQMEKRLETDENAFLETQASWLGKSVNDVIPALIRKTPEWRKKRIDAIESELNVIIGTPLDQTQNESLRKAIKYPLRDLLSEASDYETVTGVSLKTELSALGKDTISPKRFNRIVSYLKIPYKMEKQGQSHYIISRDNPAPVDTN